MDDQSNNSLSLALVRFRKLFSSNNERLEAVIAKGASVGFLINLSGTLLTLLTHIVLARLLGAEQYGIYVYAFTWVSVLTLFAKVGFDTTFVRYLARYKSAEEWSLFRGILSFGGRYIFTVSIAVLALASLVVYFLQGKMSEELYRTFLIAWILLPFATLSALRVAALRALRAVALAQLPEMVLRPLILIAGAIVIYFFVFESIDASTMMLVDLAAHVATFVLGGYWLSGKLPSESKGVEKEMRTSEWVRCGLSLLLLSGMLRIMNRVDTIMIGMLLDTTQAGIYVVASRGARLAVFGTGAVNMIMAPIISSLYAEEKKEELQRMLTLAARFISSVTVPVVLVLIFGGKYFLQIFGSEFLVAYPCLLLLLLGQVVSAFCGSVGYVLSMTGHQNTALKFAGSSAVLNIILNLLLIPKWGIEGAGVATAISVAYWNLASLFYVKTKLGLRTSII